MFFLVPVLGVALFLQRSEVTDLRADPLAVAVEETREQAGTTVIAMTGYYSPDTESATTLGNDCLRP